MWQTWLPEARLATRRLVRVPAFTAAVVATLGLAVGATAAMFAVVNRVVLSPLPYHDSDRLLMLQWRVPNVVAPPITAMPIGLYFQSAQRAQTLEAMAAYRFEERTVTGDGEPQRVNALLTTPSLATVLGVAPVAGRRFTEADGRPGAAGVAVLSHGFWTRRYGGRPEAIGRPLTLSGVSTTIVGVMPPSFFFPTQGAATDLGSPTSCRPHMASASSPTAPWAGEAAVGGHRPEGVDGRRVPAVTWLLFAAVALVLLVACANVGNLFLVRLETRQAEISLRSALGAGRVERLRSFLNEAALLALAGCAVGLALAAAAVRLVVAYGPASLPRLTEVHLDTATILFALGLGVPIALVFAVVLLHGGRAGGPRVEGKGQTLSRQSPTSWLSPADTRRPSACRSYRAAASPPET